MRQCSKYKEFRLLVIRDGIKNNLGNRTKANTYQLIKNIESGMKKVFLSIIAVIAFLSSSQSYAQSDPVLFSVQNQPVNVSEFKYIYEKTNGAKADYSEESVKEYLDLYTKFKLKVRKARDLKLDTLSSLRTELAGYRKQLANTYLMDKEVTEKLTMELYDRMKKDISFSHIFIKIPPQATPADTLAAYTKITSALAKLKKSPFETVAKEMSEDKNSAEKGGKVGFITAPLPSGFYNLENVLYTTNPGTVVGPIRTPIGYHIIRVNEVRPARGSMEVAHILIRTPKADSGSKRNIKAAIDSVYNELKNGAAWEYLVSKFSEDGNTKTTAGNLGMITINKFEAPFEDAAFALTKDGEYSKPIETSAGWHIIRRVSKKNMDSYEAAKKGLQGIISRDTRIEEAKNSFVSNVKKQNGYKENTENLKKYSTTLDSSFLTFKWMPDDKLNNLELFSFNNTEKYTVKDFNEYLSNNQRARLRLAGNFSIPESAHKLMDEYVSDIAIKNEEGKLEQKYPEFKSLMREYEEGILLFEVTKNMVWDKASTDTVGLEKFYQTVKGKYLWDERALINHYTIKGVDDKASQKIVDYLNKNGWDKTVKKFNKKEQVITFEEQIVEKSNAKELNDIKWESGFTTPLKKDETNKVTTFAKLEKIIPPTEKSLKEARGYVIAEYQDYLEKNWIAELQKTYNLQINQEVVNSMIKK